MINLQAAGSLGIGLSVFLDNQFSRGARTIQQEMAALGMSADKFVSHARNVQQFGDALAEIGDRVTAFSMRGVKSFMEFENTMNSARTIAGLSKTSDGYARMTDQAKSLGQEFGMLPNEIAGAQLELAKAGLNEKKIRDYTKAVVALGAATETSIAGRNGTAEMLVNIMQAFNAASTESMYYADVLTSAANQSTIDVTDFYESLRYSGDVASTLGIPIDKVAKAIATLGNAGLKGSMAGTAYANMLRYMSSGISDFGTPKQQKALKALGLLPKDFMDSSGNLKDLGQVLQMLDQATENMSSIDKLGILTALTGVRGNRALINLMEGKTIDEFGRQVSAYEDIERKINQDITNNIATKTAVEMLDDLKGDWDKTRVAFTRAMISLGSSLAPILRPLLQGLTSVLGWIADLSESPVGQFILRWTSLLFMVLGPLGRLISLGARFAIFMSQSSNSITKGFMTGQVAAKSIAATLRAAGKQFVADMLRARGISTFTTARGTPMLQGRGAGGRFTGGRVRSNWFTRFMGMIFGRGGIRVAGSIGKFFTMIGTKLPFLAKMFTGFGLVGKVLGKVLGWLLGWEIMLADLIVTLVSGKSIFEWLWDSLKWLGNHLREVGEFLNPKNWIKGIGSLFDSDVGNVKVNPYTGAPSGPDTASLSPATYNNYIKEAGKSQSQTINITVNPTTGDKRTISQFKLEEQRAFNNLGIQM